MAKRTKTPRDMAEAKLAALGDHLLYPHDQCKLTAWPMVAAAIADGFMEFIMLIATDWHFMDFRNVLHAEWGRLYSKPVRDLGPAPGNFFSDEALVIAKMREQHPDMDTANMSMYQMFVLIYGQEYADAYKAMMDSNCYEYVRVQYNIMRSGMGLSTYEQELAAEIAAREASED